MGLLEIDYYLFDVLNSQWTNGFLDTIMPYWRSKYMWTPMYVFLLSFLLLNFDEKKVLWVIIGTVVLIILSDQISSSVIKPWVGRLRPCKTPELWEHIRLLIKCGSGKSFVSAHATNHFALAMYFGLLLRHIKFIILPVALLWAASISYGQVYVGVHFPSDVLAGGLLGCGVGYCCYVAISKIIGGLIPLDEVASKL